MIKALIFDVGGVLFLPKDGKKEKHLLSSFYEACLLLKDFGIDTSNTKEELREVYLKSSMGDIIKEETANLMASILKVSPERLEEAFKKVYADNTCENIELYEYLLALRSRGYKIGILTTQFHLSKEVLVPKKYYKDFDALEISCDDKIKKPDKKAFELILKRLGVKENNSVFIDDQQKNLDAAKEVGMETVLFKDNKQFFQELNSLLPY